MTDHELKERAASLVTAQKETDRQIKALGQQIGGLGEKFGRFTEGLALPSRRGKGLYGHVVIYAPTPLRETWGGF